MIKISLHAGMALLLSFFNFMAVAQSIKFNQKMKSNYSFEETASRLRNLLQEKDIKIFAEVDHAAEAKTAGLSLNPTLLFIVGNPKAGTPFMQKNQEVGIELPLKILVYQDEKSNVYIRYKNISSLQKEYGLTAQHKEALTKIDENIKMLISKVAL